MNLTSRHRGLAIPLVLFVAVMLLMMGFAIFITNRRQQNVIANENQAMDFEFLNSRLKFIFQSTQLCTCNLKDLYVSGPPGPISNWSVDLDQDSTQQNIFGFYAIDPADSTHKFCKSGSVFNRHLDTNKDVVIHLNKNHTYPKAFLADRLKIKNFVLISGTSNPLISRYKAQIEFEVSDKQLRARSNMKNPVALDVYVELSGSMILQCFQPQLTSPGPNPSPAPSPGPSPSSPSTPPASSPGPAPLPMPSSTNCSACPGPIPCDCICTGYNEMTCGGSTPPSPTCPLPRAIATLWGDCVNEPPP